MCFCKILLTAQLRLLLSGECILLSSVSSQPKFETTDVRALGVSWLSDRPCYSSRCEGMPTHRCKEKRVGDGGRERPPPSGSSFYVFSSPWVCPM